jgi:hypothetical protein
MHKVIQLWWGQLCLRVGMPVRLDVPWPNSTKLTDRRCVFARPHCRVRSPCANVGDDEISCKIFHGAARDNTGGSVCDNIGDLRNCDCVTTI